MDAQKKKKVRKGEAFSIRFRKVANRYPLQVTYAYDRDHARAMKDSDEEVARTVAKWERSQGMEPRDWTSIGRAERGDEQPDLEIAFWGPITADQLSLLLRHLEQEMRSVMIQNLDQNGREVHHTEGACQIAMSVVDRIGKVTMADAADRPCVTFNEVRVHDGRAYYNVEGLDDAGLSRATRARLEKKIRKDLTQLTDLT